MGRVLVNGVVMQAPDGLTPEELIAWGQTHKPPAPPGPPDTTGPVMAAATAPVPPARAVPLPPPRPLLEAVAAGPLPYAAQGSKSGWILPAADNPAWMPQRAPAIPTTATPPAGQVPTTPASPALATTPATEPLTAPAPGPVTTAPLPPVSAGTPPAAPAGGGAPAVPGAVPGGAPARFAKVNGVRVQLPPDWDSMDPAEKIAWGKGIAAPQTVPDALTRQPGAPPIPQAAPTPAPYDPAVSPLVKPAEPGPLPLPTDPNVRLVPSEAVAREHAPQGLIPGAVSTRPPVPEVGQRFLSTEQDVKEARAAKEAAKHTAFTRGFVRSLSQEQPESVAEGLEGLGLLTGETKYGEWSKAVRDFAGMPKEEYARQGRGILDAMNWDELSTAIGETAGSGAASTAPSLFSGMVLGYLGKRYGGRVGGIAGGIAGAAMPSAVVNYGDTFKQMKDAGIPPEQAAIVAAWATGPITGLDVFGLEGMTGKLPPVKMLKQWAIQGFAQRIAARGLEGASFESITEMMQQVIQDGVTNYQAGKPLVTAEAAKSALEAGIGGALVGGPAGAAHGVLPEPGAHPVPQPQPQPELGVRPSPEAPFPIQEPAPAPPQPGPTTAPAAPVPTEPPAAATPGPAPGVVPGGEGRPPAPSGAALPVRPGVDTKNWSPKMQETFNTVQQGMIDAGIDQAQVTSAFRSPEHNRAVGGAGKSTHMHGDATDISLKGLTEEQKQKVVDIVLAQPGVTGFGYYPNSDSIHFDVGHPTRSAWGSNYSSSSIGQGWAPWMTEKVNAWRGGAAPSAGGAPGAVAAPGQALPGSAPSGPARLSNPTHENAIRSAATAAGLDPDMMVRIAEIESKGDPNAKNPASTAGGLFQFTDGTWSENGQGDKFDPNANIAAAVKLTKSNVDGLTKALGRAPEPWEVYLAHQQGLGGALKILQGEGNAVSVLGRDAVVNNGGDESTSMAGFRELWRSKYGAVGGGVSTAAGGSTTLPGEAGAVPAAPATTSAGSVPGGAPAPSEAAEPAFAPKSGRVETSASVPQTNTLTTDAGEIQTRPMVVDLADITHSGQPGYDQALQPRDRDRAASQVQVAKIAGNLDPRQITSITGDASTGPPIINSQGMVESGNGRTMALEQAYAQNLPGAAAYRAQLESMGFNVSGMKNPILVQQRTSSLTPEQTQSFVQGANASRSLRMSTAEQARADSRRVGPDMLRKLTVGSRDPAKNPAFRQAFMQGVPSTEQGAMIGPDGELTADGQRRVRNAVLTSAYGESPAIERILETTDDNTKTLSQAMMENAPDVARVRAGVASGEIDQSFQVAIDAIPTAVQQISDIRSRGGNVISFLDQQDAFNQVSPEVEAWMRMFVKPDGKPTSLKAVGDAMGWFADEALKTAGQEQGLGLGLEPVTSGQLLTGAGEVARGKRQRRGDQGQLAGLGERRAEPRADRAVPDRNAGRPQAPEPGAGEVGGRQADQAGAELADRASRGGETPDTVEALAETQPKHLRRRAPKPPKAPKRGTPMTTDAIFDRAAYTQHVSNYEDVFHAAGISPEDAKNMPIGKRWQIARDQLLGAFGLANVDKTPGAITFYAVDQLRDAYRNMTWMANVLQLPAKALGLNQHFGLTLQRESKRYFGAFYPEGHKGLEGLSPTTTPQIALPGRSRSYAHEWGHALDHWLQAKMFGDKADPYLLTQWIKALKDPSQFQGGHFGIPPRLHAVAKAMGDVVSAMYLDAEGNPNQFYKSAMDYAGPTKKAQKYWAGAHEMFARAFEAYVADKVDYAGGTTEFISKNSDLYESGSGERFEKTFPKASERMRIFAAMDNLLGEVAALPELVGQAALPPPDVERLPSAWTKTVSGAQPQGVKQAIRTGLDSVIQDVAPAIADLRAAPGKAAGAVVNLTEGTVSNWRGSKIGQVAHENVFRSLGAQLRAMAARTRSATLAHFVDQLQHDPASGRTIKETYEEARNTRFRTFANRLSATVRKYKLGKLSVEDTAKLRELMVTGGKTEADFRQIDAPPRLKKAAAELRHTMDMMFDYARKAGLPIGYARNGYLPRIENEEAIEADVAGFLDKAAQVYDLMFERDVAEDTDALMDDIHGRKWDLFLEALSASTVSKSDKRALTKALREAREDENADTIDALSEALEAVYQPVREHFAQVNAEAYKNAILDVGLGHPVQPAPPSGFLKKRTLPPEADMILADYYHNDPLDLMYRYANKVTRTAEITRRWGQHNEGFSNALRKMQAEGLSTDDLEYVKSAYLRVTSQERQNLGYQGKTGQALDTIQGVGTAGMLARSLFSNLLEPGVAAWQTGQIGDLPMAYGMILQHGADKVLGWFGGGLSTVEYHNDLSRMLGIFSDALIEQQISDRYAGTISQSAATQRRLSKYYEHIQLAPYTRASRTVAQRLWLDHLQDTLTRYLANPEDAMINGELTDGGIDESIRPAFAKWYTERFMPPDGAPMSLDKLEDDPMLPILQAAIGRYVDMSVQDPKRIDKPYLATSRGHKMRLMFGLMSFNYAFTQNVLKRLTRIHGKNAYELDGGARLRATAKLAAITGMYVTCHALITLMRSFLFDDPDKWEEVKKGFGDTFTGDWTTPEARKFMTQTLSRAGLFGAADPIVNLSLSLSGLGGSRYEFSTWKYALGPTMGTLFDNIDKIAGYFSPRNSVNTTTAEYNALRGLYSIGMQVVAPWMLGGIQSNIIGGVLGFGYGWLGGRGGRDKVITGVTGMPVPTSQEAKDEAKANVKALHATPEWKAEHPKKGKGKTAPKPPSFAQPTF